MAVPRDVRGGENHGSSAEIEQDAEIAAVETVDEHTADEGNKQAGKRDHDNLHAHGDGGMRGRKDVPADRGEIEAAAEQRDEHRHREESEAALCPDQFPVDAVVCGGCGGGHGICHFTIGGTTVNALNSILFRSDWKMPSFGGLWLLG